MTMEKIPVAACANGVLMQAFYDRSKNDIVIFDNVGKALGYIKARPAVHGRWIKDSRPGHADWDCEYSCSVCGVIAFTVHSKRFCPNCGSEMLEVRDGQE